MKQVLDLQQTTNFSTLNVFFLHLQYAGYQKAHEYIDRIDIRVYAYHKTSTHFNILLINEYK